MKIQYWPFEKITEQVLQLIVDRKLFDPKYATDNTGLFSAVNYFHENNCSMLSHLWFAELEGEWVGVCGIKHTGDPTVNIYVKPEHRRKGIGSQLLDLALATGEKFGSCHTETGKHLYLKYGLPDYVTNPPWAINREPTHVYP